MELVVDANILFAALIRNSHTRHLLILGNHKYYVPEFILDEMHKYTSIILKKTGLSKEDLTTLLKDIVQAADITIIPASECKNYISEAEKISPDPKDVAYFALALKLKCVIWSNDKALKKQDRIKVYNTEDITEIK